MQTPCVAACKNSGGICSGCKRTIPEIIQWKNMSEDQRLNIMDALKGEAQTHQCEGCGKPSQCDISAGKSTCWCFELDEREISSELKEASSCLCRSCLEKQPIK